MNANIVPRFHENQKTMSSREISILTDSDHSNVLKTIRTLMLKGVVSGNETLYRHEQNGQLYPEIHLDFRNTMVVVSGYSAELRAKIIDRWQELENKVAFDITNPAHLLQAIEIQAKQNIALKQELEIQAPKVAFVDKYVAGNGNKTFRQVAKLLQIKEYKFREFLESNRIMYKLNGEWTAYQNHVDAKRFHNNTGVSNSGHTFNRSLFTPKGIEWIAGELAKSQVRGAA